MVLSAILEQSSNFSTTTPLIQRFRCSQSNL